MPIKTTIDANAPILMQWIVSSTDRLNDKAEPGRHPLPNTKTFPHRQRLVNMAKVEPDRLICLYYLGDTLNEEQNKQMQDLEKLAQNIRAINFNKLDWSEYDFEFNTSMLSVDDEGENMKMTEYLNLPNTDNRLGFRVDMMRTLMLLKAEQGIIEADKMKEGENIGEGAIFFDFDFVLNGQMGELQTPYGMLSGCNKGSGNVFDFFYYASAAVTESKNSTLINAYKNIKNCIIQGEIKKNKLDSGPVQFFFKNEQIGFFQNSLVFYSVAGSIANLIVDRLPVETKDKISSTTDNEKYRLISELITEDKIGFIHATKKNADLGHGLISATIDGGPFHSWATSEDLDVNKNFGSNTTYTKIFDMMYKDTELEIKNIVSTNLKDVKQEQNKGYCRLQ